jgi:hypothetical protein
VATTTVVVVDCLLFLMGVSGSVLCEDCVLVTSPSNNETSLTILGFLTAVVSGAGGGGCVAGREGSFCWEDVGEERECCDEDLRCWLEEDNKTDRLIGFFGN